jgi:hypothetical protein
MPVSLGKGPPWWTRRRQPPVRLRVPVPVRGPAEAALQAPAPLAAEEQHCPKSTGAPKLSSMTVRPLGGGAVTHFHGIGSFSDDPRFGTNNNRFSYDAKFNISSSFSLKDVLCNTCPSKGPHTVLYRKGGWGTSGRNNLLAVLS